MHILPFVYLVGVAAFLSMGASASAHEDDPPRSGEVAIMIVLAAAWPLWVAALALMIAVCGLLALAEHVLTMNGT